MKARTAYIALLVVIYLAFISLGLPDSGFGIAWPFMSAEFAKPLEAAGILTITLTVFSALSSFASGHVLLRFGTGPVTFVSCLMTATGLIGYALAPSFLWLLPCIPLLGFGAGSIDCGLNYFVAENYSGRHMNWLHCCWGVGATLGPVILTTFVARSGAWRSGYFTIGSIQLALSLVLFLSLGLWIRVQRDKKAERERNVPSNVQVLDQATQVTNAAENADGTTDAIAAGVSPARGKAMTAQIFVFAFYTSCEYIAGLWAFSLLVQARGISAATAGLWVALYYGSLTVGRFLTGFVVDRFGNRRMIKAGLFVAFAGAALIALPSFVPGASDLSAFFGLILLGAGFAPLYPCMMHETPRRFRADTAQKIIGYQSSAAYIGASLSPALVGLAGAHTTLEIIPFVEAALIASIIALVFSLDLLTSKGLL
jgi:MFS family permease